MASAYTGDDNEKKKSNSNPIRSGFLGKTGTDEAPIDKTYYNILNVLPTASATEIKRAYYTLSLQYHPDRTQNLDDLTRRDYAERFKLISTAYAILSDPEKRTLYNRYGKDERLVNNDSSGISFEDFNAEEFFRFMFGGEAFIEIVGNFELATSFTHAISEVLQESEQTREQQEEQRQKRLAFLEERKEAHERRIEQLSTNLKSKLAIFTNECSSLNDESQATQAMNHFVEFIRSDLPNLLEAPYGEQLLHSIGYIYSSKARSWLSKMDSQEGHLGKRIIGYGKHIHSTWKDRIHVVKETVKTVKSAVQWGQSMSKLSQIADEEDQSTDSQTPFQHHSGHLEYSGFTPSEQTTTPSATTSASPSASPVKQKSARKSSTQPIVPLTDEDKRKLEADTAAKSLEALWRATKMEVESIERDVCDRVLNDSTCSREVRRYRCKALFKLGELWQQATHITSESS